jgi:hypothetical protein
LKDKPIENKWIRTLTTYIFNQGWYEAEIGCRCKRGDKKRLAHTISSDVIQVPTPNTTNVGPGLTLPISVSSL